MAHIVEINNPFDPLKDSRCTETAGGMTLHAWLLSTYPGFVEFERPTICLVNGHAMKRAEWDTYEIKQNDVINFVAVPGVQALVYVFYALLVISVVYSVYMLATMPKPQTPGSLPEADPTYDLKGQTNQLKLGVPIEVPYGRCRLWPTYAARPYSVYASNEQFQFSLYCLGQGKFSIEDVRIEDTPIGNFEDITYEIYAPGQQVTLFPDNVITSVEVGQIELFSSNEPEYSGSSGPYVANPTQSLCNRLEIDISFPLGLYLANDSGGLGNITVTALFEYHEIDNDGNPVGSWVTLSNFSKTLKTNTPQRFTVGANVTQGRYQVRGVRTNAKNTDAKAANIIQWVALRAFLPSTKDYGDVTLIALKARASNNLNDRASARLNLYATRKLRTRVAGAWTAEVATRSPVWALCDVFQSTYGGRLGDSFLDLETLETLAEYYDENETYFDFVFDQRLTVWEAAKTIARVGRAVPMLNGSRITMIREQPKTLPTAIFNPDNIVENSFTWEIKLPGIDENDGVEIEYTDPDTWKSETIKCLVGGDEGENCEQIKLPGCTSRTVAYREGMYIRSTRKLIRENVKFKTGLEGHIPSYGDLIGVNHDLPRWSQGGLVVAIDGLDVTLSEPVTFGVGTHVIGIRTKSGAVSGPHVVTAGADAFHLVLTAPIDTTNFYFDSVREFPLFLFGTSAAWAKLCVVVGLEPSDDDTVEVKSVAYTPEVFAFDAATAPPMGTGSTPGGVPDLPTVTGLIVTEVVGSLNNVLASWNPALGAQYYLVQRSYNETDWETIGTSETNFLQFTVTPGVVYVRVAGVNVGQGPWIDWAGYVGVPFVPVGSVDNLQLDTPFVGSEFMVIWDAADEAASYLVQIYTNAGADLMRSAIVVGTEYTYTNAQALIDGNVSRDIRVSVRGRNLVGITGPESTLDVSNPIPAALSGIASELLSASPTIRTYRATWTPSAVPDLAGYRLYGSATSGFTPGPSNLLYDGSTAQYDVALLLTSGVHPTYYFRVAAYDVWGTDSFNFAAEQSLPFSVLLVNNSGDYLINNNGDFLKA